MKTVAGLHLGLACIPPPKSGPSGFASGSENGTLGKEKPLI
jgi:hypothetical protein